jgi:hypothetical protein
VLSTLRKEIKASAHLDDIKLLPNLISLFDRLLSANKGTGEELCLQSGVLSQVYLFHDSITLGGKQSIDRDMQT